MMRERRQRRNQKAGAYQNSAQPHRNTPSAFPSNTNTSNLGNTGGGAFAAGPLARSGGAGGALASAGPAAGGGVAGGGSRGITFPVPPIIATYCLPSI